jgi:LDH2 family malate/lactate/ureidoglycolate dehydrogenase
LSGMGIGSMPGFRNGWGTVLAAFDITAFLPLDEFQEQTELFCQALADTPLAEGSGEVLVPGEPEERIRRERVRDGIPVTENTWRELNALLRTEEE